MRRGGSSSRGACPSSSAMTTTAAALELENVSKSYPGVQALADVSFTVNHGEIHALLGENGAGKSTLVKLVMGATRPDSGVIRVDGEPVHLRSPRDARRHGVSMIPQEVEACAELVVGRNILLGHESLFVRRTALSGRERRTVEDALARIGADVQLGSRAGDLNVPTLRLAQIAHSVVTESQIVLCDEATSVLSESDAESFLEFLVKSKNEARGAIVYVTHRLSEVLQIADRITVLRDGRNVGTFDRSEVDRPKLIALMTKAAAEREEAPQELVVAERRNARGDADGAPAWFGSPLRRCLALRRVGQDRRHCRRAGCRARAAARGDRRPAHVRARVGGRRRERASARVDAHRLPLGDRARARRSAKRGDRRTP